MAIHLFLLKVVYLYDGHVASGVSKSVSRYNASSIYLRNSCHFKPLSKAPTHVAVFNDRIMSVFSLRVIAEKNGKNVRLFLTREEKSN